ncbi:polyhydroxyalkanoate granule-associated phasin [Caballeronia sp. LZ001]|uniref:polyhydroxyalkanoate granule-associated phasin n=1 Tax=Caballeronia sp. LZ001 TaxID=3038553 RepID=UPI00285920A0|nr:polyhydroxyalkanoate granule-associated phasin [Caballeronia sp. LZ001]MDR5799345.1 hypothetical protein [Caballeronia sp. LZ001]
MAASTSASPFRDLSTSWFETLSDASEMFRATSQVVGHRTVRMAMAGPLPSERDQTEFSLMSTEKKEAATEALQALGSGCLSLAITLAADTTRLIWEASSATIALASSQTASQWLERQAVLLGVVNNAPINPLRLANSATHVIQETLAPIHDRATANAKRLGAL